LKSTAGYTCGVDRDVYFFMTFDNALMNGLKHAEFSVGDERVRLSGLKPDRKQEGDRAVRISALPDFAHACGVIGLDGASVSELWKLAFDDVNHQCMLINDEREARLAETQDLTIARTSECVKP
jgi:hypothetical protein